MYVQSGTEIVCCLPAILPAARIGRHGNIPIAHDGFVARLDHRDHQVGSNRLYPLVCHK